MIKIVVFFMVFTLSVFAENYWESYLEYNVKHRAYNDTNTLIRLFNHYDNVKDDPFSLGSLSNKIVANIYNSHSGIGDNRDYHFFDGYGDVFTYISGDSYYPNNEQFYNMYKVLYDNMHKFDIEKKVRDGLELFVDNKINEMRLFYEIIYAFTGVDYQLMYAFANGVEESELVKIELLNSDDEINGLTIKHNGKVAPGMLNRRTDYEYTIDYNGKKNVKIKYAELKIIYPAYRFWSGEAYENSMAVHSILIGENNYYIYYNIYISSQFGDEYKIRDLNNHEDGIIRVEIIK